jgi:hypothetical protein
MTSQWPRFWPWADFDPIKEQTDDFDSLGADRITVPRVAALFQFVDTDPRAGIKKLSL